MNPVLSAGHQLGAYEVQEALGECGGRARYRARDAAGEPFMLTHVGHCSVAPERRDRVLARVKRTLSWHQDPMLLAPVDFQFEGDTCYAVSLLPAEQHMLAALPATNLDQLLKWMRNLSEALGHLHEARQPRYLGSLPMENLRVCENGDLQLLGLEVNGDLRLEYVPFSEAPHSPDKPLQPKSDLWALGNWFASALELVPEKVRQEYRQDPLLVALVTSLVAQDAGQRPLSPAVFRTRLDGMSITRGIAQEGTARLEEAVKELSIARKASWKGAGDDYRRLLLALVCALITFLAFMNLSFPAHP